MNIKILIVILASIIILSHCKQNIKPGHEDFPEAISIDEQQSANIRFTFKKNTATRFIAYPRISVSLWHDKIILYGIYQATNERPKLVARTFTKGLELKGERYFNFGQGPGDVGSNNMITIAKDKILISENSNFRVSIYDHDWNLQTAARHKLNIDAFVLYDNASFFITGSLVDRGNMRQAFSWQICSFPGFKTDVLFTTKAFYPIKKFGDSYKGILGGNTEYSWFYKNKEIFILLCGKYRILKFDNTGKKLRDIIVTVDEVKTDHSLDEKFFKENNILKHKKMFFFSDTVDPAAMMIPLMKGFVVVRRQNQYSAECSGFSEGDYFSYQLEYLGKVKVPCFYNQLTLNSGRNSVNLGFDDGFLYLITEKDEDFFIEKWEVGE